MKRKELGRVRRSLISATVLVFLLPLGATAQTSTEAPAPLAHIAEADRLLSEMAQWSLKGETKKRTEDLQKDFAALVDAYKANPDPFIAPLEDERPSQDSTKKNPAMNWKAAFSEVEYDLA